MTENNSNCLIIDTGSWLVKSGLSNEDVPKIVSPTIYGQEINQTKTGYNFYYGNEAQERRKNLQMFNLFKDNEVLNWERLELYWKHMTTETLQLKMSERAVLTNCYSDTNKLIKEKQTQIFFESFNVPYYYSITNALLSLYSSGRTNGIVIDSGHGKTCVVPIFEGTPFYFAQNMVERGGKDITEYIQKLYNVDFYDAQMLKEKYVKIPNLYNQKEKIVQSTMEIEQEIKETTLPDGKKIEFKNEFVNCGGGIFNPKKINLDEVGIQELIYDTIQKLDSTYTREILQNLIITGGNTNFTNFNNRLQKEVSLLIPPNYKIKCYNTNDKINSVWIGGAIISFLGSFQPMWITRNEYDEFGPSIINRKSIQLIIKIHP